MCSPDGTVVRVPHGTPLLTRITGGGCALGALMAAFTAVRTDPAAAAVAATTVYTLAAEDAAAESAGPEPESALAAPRDDRDPRAVRGDLGE